MPELERLSNILQRFSEQFGKDSTQFYKQFVENDEFKRFVGDMVFAMTNGVPTGVAPTAHGS